VGRRPLISLESIVQASLAIADAEGLGALTMQAVARRLGVTPMALYRHVRDKAELLDRVVEALLTEVPLPADDLPWDERLRTMGRSIRTVARRHPAVFPLLLQRPATTSESRRVRDAVCLALQEAGFAADVARRAERLLSTAVLGFAVSEAGGRFRGHSRRTLDEDFACLEDGIRHLLDYHLGTRSSSSTRASATS
jgi:AcrR family transcriptional regulator